MVINSYELIRYLQSPSTELRKCVIQVRTRDNKPCAEREVFKSYRLSSDLKEYVLRAASFFICCEKMGLSK